LVTNNDRFEESFVAAINKESNYLRTLPFWPMRWPYWFFIRRGKWHNKSIKEQYEKGLIKLPLQLSEDIDIPLDIIPIEED